MPFEYVARILDINVKVTVSFASYHCWVCPNSSSLFSDEGKSFSFDSRGTGYGRGEGCGIVVLKPLYQALKDNDKIRCIITATGINQDGKTPGITMPNGFAQGISYIYFVPSNVKMSKANILRVTHAFSLRKRWH